MLKRIATCVVYVLAFSGTVRAQGRPVRPDDTAGSPACCSYNGYHVECTNLYCDTSTCVCDSYYGSGVTCGYRGCISNGTSTCSLGPYTCCRCGDPLAYNDKPYQTPFNRDLSPDRGKLQYIAVGADWSMDMSHFVKTCRSEAVRLPTGLVLAGI
jgi:hypothetical protein